MHPSILDRPMADQPHTTMIDELRIVRLRAAGAWRPAPSAVGVFVVHVLAGRPTIEHGRGGDVLQTGEILVTTADARPGVFLDGPDEIQVIQIPPASAGALSSVFAAAVGRRWRDGGGAPSIVGHVLDGIAAHPIGMASANDGRLAQHIVGLIGLMCADATMSERDALLHTSKQYVEAHLADLDLCAERVASVLNVSTRTLHRLFESDGHTLGSWIRERRLEHCRADLADAGSDRLAVSAIGARWGIVDAAHLSRTFKARYGVGPRAYRAAQEQLRRERRGRIGA